MPKPNEKSSSQILKIIGILDDPTIPSEDKVFEICIVINADESLIALDFDDHGCSILHLAILKNLPQLARELIDSYRKLLTRKDRYKDKNEEKDHDKKRKIAADIALYRELFTRNDNNGKNAAHYIVEYFQEGRHNKKSQELLTEVLHAAPDIFHKPDKNDKSAYRYAGLLEKTWAIAVFQDVMKKKIREEFPSLNLFPKTKIEITNRGSSIQISNAGQITQGSHKPGSAVTRRYSIFLPASAEKSNPKPASEKYVRELINNGDIKRLKKYIEEDGNDPNASIFDACPLIKQAFILTTAPTDTVDGEDKKKKYQEIFLLLLKHAPQLDIKNKKGVTLLRDLHHDNKNKDPIRLLQRGYVSLAKEITKLNEEFNDQMSTLELKFETCLSQLGLNYQQKTKGTYQTLPELKDVNLKSNPNPDQIKQFVTLMLWNTCTVIETEAEVPGVQKRFDKYHISCVIQGLLSQTSPDEVTGILISLFPHFDLNQRLVANFILKELLMLDPHNETIKSPTMLAQIKNFIAANQTYIPAHAEQLNSILNGFINLKQQHANPANSVIRTNYNILSAYMNDPDYPLQLKSFDGLLKEILAAKSDIKDSDIELISNEFKTLMQDALQKIDVREFDECVKSEASDKLWPNVALQSMIVTNITNYLQDLFFKLSNEQSNKLVTLLIEVANSLCKANDVAGPDLNSVCAIIFALDAPFIRRIKSRFSFLEKNDNLTEKFEDLKKLTEPTLNFQWLKAMEEASDGTLLLSFIVLRKALALIWESNSENFYNLTTSLGVQYRKFLQHQIKQTGTYHPKTTFFEMILHREFISQEKLEDFSYQLLPFGSLSVGKESKPDTTAKLDTSAKPVTSAKPDPVETKKIERKEKKEKKSKKKIQSSITERKMSVSQLKTDTGSETFTHNDSESPPTVTLPRP